MLYQMALAGGVVSGGSTIRSIEAALSRSGQCLSCLCPYERVEGAIAVSLAAIEDGLKRKAVLKAHSATYKSVVDLLMMGTPVVLVVRMCDSFFDTPDGLVETPTAAQVINDLHAVLAVGVVGWKSLPVIEFRNSWGQDWGDNGYGYLQESYIDKYCTFAGVVLPFAV